MAAKATAPQPKQQAAAAAAAPAWQAEPAASSDGRGSKQRQLRDWRAEDPAYVAESDDDGKARHYWTIKQCPIDGCSKNSWSKVRCWSYASAEECLDKLKVHAMASSLHAFEEERAQAMVDDAAVIDSVALVEETPEERANYRAFVEQREIQKARFVANVARDAARSAAAQAEAHFDFVAAAK